MKRRYFFFRRMGCGPFTAGFIALLNEISDLPPHKAGFMHMLWDMEGDQ